MSLCPSPTQLQHLLDGGQQDDVAPLEAHVEACSACREILERLCVDDVTSQWQVWWKEADRPNDTQRHILDRLDRYVVKEVLGAGGFARVYRCYDTVLEQDVAVKVPHPHRISSTADVDAYLDEARKWAGLKHPGIARFLHADRASGSCYVVSEFINGSNLRQKIDRARPSYVESAAITAQVATALHHVHIQRLYHRDIKPSNILIDTGGKPYVTDFGLALSEDEIGKGFRQCGTLRYQSPEQARGEGHLVDGRTDVYSLGVVLYELLTDQVPFDAQTDAEVRELIIRREPRPLRMIDDRIPKELERI